MPEQSENRPLTGKAVTYKGSGGYEVIQFLERAVRAPAADEVCIEVKAAAVNPTDLLLRARGFDNQGSPVVPGMDAAGIIESVGTGVSRLRPGEKRSEEHTSELQSLMRNSYAVFCLKK